MCGFKDKTVGLFTTNTTKDYIKPKLDKNKCGGRKNSRKLKRTDWGKHK